MSQSASVFTRNKLRRSDRISLTGSSWLHKYQPENKHVIGERATGKLDKESVTWQLKINPISHHSLDVKAFLMNGILFGSQDSEMTTLATHRNTQKHRQAL